MNPDAHVDLQLFAAEQPLTGRLIDGRFHLLRVLGRGGMGVVYEAEQLGLGRRCAVKVIAPQSTRSQTAARRFNREARLLAGVSHPHVVQIYDAGTSDDGVRYIAMEMLIGESLEQVLRSEGRLPWLRAKHIIMQVCEALSAAHAQGVVHRDMKPANCFLTHIGNDDAFVKVLDFGISKQANGFGEEKITTGDAVVGTASYMSYEQIQGEPCDHRADLWAVGVMLYEMLSGQLPFRGSTQWKVWMAIAELNPAPLQLIAPDATLPAGINDFIARALAKDRERRFQSAEEFSEALRSLDGESEKFDTPNMCRTRLHPQITQDVPLGSDVTDQVGGDARQSMHHMGPRSVWRQVQAMSVPSALISLSALLIVWMLSLGLDDVAVDLSSMAADHVAPVALSGATEAYEGGVTIQSGEPVKVKEVRLAASTGDSQVNLPSPSETPSAAVARKKRPSPVLSRALSCSDLRSNRRIRECVRGCDSCGATIPVTFTDNSTIVVLSTDRSAATKNGVALEDCLKNAMKSLTRKRPITNKNCELK